MRTFNFIDKTIWILNVEHVVANQTKQLVRCNCLTAAIFTFASKYKMNISFQIVLTRTPCLLFYR